MPRVPELAGQVRMGARNPDRSCRKRRLFLVRSCRRVEFHEERQRSWSNPRIAQTRECAEHLRGPSGLPDQLHDRAIGESPLQQDDFLVAELVATLYRQAIVYRRRFRADNPGRRFVIACE